jgi:AraC-like DNA-binding protein
MSRLREARARIANDAVRRFMDEHHLPPTYLQLAGLLHCSEATAYRRVRDAVELGLLARSRGPWPVGDAA